MCPVSSFSLSLPLSFSLSLPLLVCALRLCVGAPALSVSVCLSDPSLPPCSILRSDLGNGEVQYFRIRYD